MRAGIVRLITLISVSALLGACEDPLAPPRRRRRNARLR